MGRSSQDTHSSSTSITAVETANNLQAKKNDLLQEKDALEPETPKFRLVKYRDIDGLAKAKRVRDNNSKFRVPAIRYMSGFDDTWSDATFKERLSVDIRSYVAFLRAAGRKIAWVIPSEDKVFTWYTPESMKKSHVLSDVLKIIPILARGKKSKLRMHEYKSRLRLAFRNASPDRTTLPHIILPPGNFRTSTAYNDIMKMICDKADLDNLPILAVHFGDDFYSGNGFVKHEVLTLGTQDKTWKEELPRLIVTLRKPRSNAT